MLGTTDNVRSHKVGEIEMDIDGGLGPHSGSSSRVQAVVDWFGPTDFTIMDECGSEMDHDAPDSPESELVGGPIQEHKDRCALANPATYVTTDDPPFLTLHGDTDPLVPHCQSEVLHEALENAGVPVELTIVSGGGHGEGLFVPRYFGMMVGFFNRVLAANHSAKA
jgi:acetyl esterase/lipase